KVKNIYDFYRYTYASADSDDFRCFYLEQRDQFMSAVPLMLARCRILPFYDLKPWTYSSFIYEGAQGIMLDMDHGVYPNVTYGHTTSRNAWKHIKTQLSHLSGRVNTV